MIELIDTNAARIAAEFVAERIRAGSPAMGMVMTLVIVVDEDDAPDAMRAARQASHEHPARVLGVILGDGRGAPQVNAQVMTGDGWTGETALIRLKGEVVRHSRVRGAPAAAPRLPRRDVVAGRPARGSRDGPARTPGAAPDHRRGGRRTRQGEGDPPAVLVVLPGQHRSRLDPDHPVARAARRRPGPARSPRSPAGR